MRILFLTHYFPPEGNAPATRVHAMAKHWVREGHEVEVITCAPNVPAGVVYQGYENRLLHRETIDGIQVTRVWTYLAANAGFRKRIANYVSFMISGVVAALASKRPDVLIATSPQLFCGWAGAIAAKLKRVPFVLEVRDIWPESIVAVGAMRQSPAIRLLEWMAHGLYSAADRIVTVGDGYRTELIQRGVPVDKIDVVPNGVDTELFVPTSIDQTMRQRWGLGDNKFVCSYVGTVGMAAGLEVVLRCARLLREDGDDSIRFLIAGDGAERAALESRAQADGLEQIVFTGRLPKNEIPRVLAASDCCLVHLRNQAIFETVLPSKLFEAAAMAKPTLLGLRGAAADLLDELNGGIAFAPESEQQLRDALRKLRDDPELARSFGESARSGTRDRFDRARLADKYISALRTHVPSQHEKPSPLASPEGRA